MKINFEDFEKAKGDDIVYFITNKIGIHYYIFCEKVFNVLIDKNIYSNMPNLEFYSLNRDDAIAKCKKINNEKYSLNQAFWLIGYK